MHFCSSGAVSIFLMRILLLGCGCSYLINGIDNRLEDGMVHGMEHWEAVFDAITAIIFVNEMAGSVRPAYWDPSYD